MVNRCAVILLLSAGAALICGCRREGTPSGSTGGGPRATPTPAQPQEPAKQRTIDPATVAAISGRVDLAGTAPAMPALRMNADAYCLSAHPQPVLAETVMVNPNGTLKNVFVYVQRGLEGYSFRPPEAAVTLNQVGCMYVPHVFGVMAGQPISIVNSDATLHNIHAITTQNVPFNFGQPRGGMSETRVFRKPEVMVKLKCDVHPWMSAYVGVVDHPFYAVTDATGGFRIAGLPPGEFVLEAWHEKYGKQTTNVTLSAGEDKQITFVLGE